MADNIIASFLVALGFDDAAASSMVGKTKRSMADYERAVREAEKRVEDARWEGAKTAEEVAKLTRETNLRLAREALANAKEQEKKEQDAAKQRKERTREFLSGLEKMALAASAAATAIGYAVGKITGSFDNLYFQAQRSGTSVQSLRALGYAFSQTGGTAQQAGAAVDSFTAALRNNPGLRQFVKELGVDGNLQGVDKFIATLDALKKEPYEVGVQHASMLGIDESTFNQYVRQSDALKRYRAEYDATSKRIGLNSDEAAQAATSFQRTLTQLQATISALGDKLLIQLAPGLEKVARGFSDWMEAHPEKVDHILKSISDAIVWLTEKITAMVEWFAGSDGDAFMKRWDDFANRIKFVADSVEKIYNFLKAIGLVTAYNTLDRIGSGLLGGPGSFERNNQGAADAARADTRKWYEKILPKSLGGKDAPDLKGTPGRTVRPTSRGIDPTVEAYIRQSAAAHGVNPDTAVAVADGEGLGGSTPNRLTPGDFVNGKPTSFGPFQLHRGGRGSVGTEYERASGHSADDPTYWKEQIDFAIRWAKKHGWSAWYGRAKHRIGEREGLDYAPKIAPSQNVVPNAFDPNNIDPKNLMPPAPSDASPTTNNTTNSRAVTQNITNNTTVQTSGDPRVAGRLMESSLGRVHSLALANAQSAIA